MDECSNRVTASSFTATQTGVWAPVSGEVVAAGNKLAPKNGHFLVQVKYILTQSL